MNKNKNIARRVFFWIVFVLFVVVATCCSLFYWGIEMLQTPMNALTAAGDELPEVKSIIALFAMIKQGISWYGVLGACLFFFLAVSLLWLPIRKHFKTTAQQVAPPSKAKKSKGQEMAEKKEQDKRLFLYLLSVLQREGRLMDFFSEDLAPFEDAQIGAAVRSIHETCKKVVDKTLTPVPVIDDEEGASITVPSGFDPSAIKLVGNVSGEPPFTGVLRHRGWQAKKVELPTLTNVQNALIISPAEVEIS